MTAFDVHLLSQCHIPTNRPVFRGTVPLFNAMPRCPALLHVCPAFYGTQHRAIATCIVAARIRDFIIATMAKVCERPTWWPSPNNVAFLLES